LGRHPEDEALITFGGWRSARTAEPLAWVALSDPGYWQFTIDDIVMNNKSARVCPEGCQVVVDTGSSLLMGPKSMGDTLEALLQTNVSDCNDTSALPTLGFKIGGKFLELTPDDYMDIGKDTCLFAWTPVKDTGKGPLLVLGMPFLRKYYTVFDFRSGSPRLGFARAHHGAAASAVPGGQAALKRKRTLEPCAICIEMLPAEEDGEDEVTLQCGHRFHTACVQEWLAKVPSCPLCKQIAVDPGRLLPTPCRSRRGPA